MVNENVFVAKITTKTTYPPTPKLKKKKGKKNT